MAQKEGLLSREKLRDLRSLDSVKIRRRKGLCMVEGERSLAEALRTRNLLYLVESDEVAACGTGLLGVARIPSPGDPQGLGTLPGRSALFYLDGIREPGNVGALIRTAWALGLGGALLGEGTADPFSAKAVRASAGGVFHLPRYEGIGARELEDLLASGYSLFTADRGGQDYRSVAYPERSILALGNEARGFSSWVMDAGQAVGIPLAEGADSLNVVVAGGVIAAQMMAAPGRGDTETR